MIQRHWVVSGAFEHYDSCDFEMLEWDALRSSDTLRLFRFEDLEAKQMREQLLCAMPAELHALVVEEPVTLQTMRHVLANRTAARFSDLDDTVIELARAKEIDILNADAKLRSRSLRRRRRRRRARRPTRTARSKSRRGRVDEDGIPNGRKTRVRQRARRAISRATVAHTAVVPLYQMSDLQSAPVLIQVLRDEPAMAMLGRVLAAEQAAVGDGFPGDRLLDASNAHQVQEA